MPDFQPDTPEALDVPAYLSKGAKKIFRQLVAESAAAKVPIKHVDASAFAMAALSVEEIARLSEESNSEANPERRMEISSLIARHGRDLQNWLAVIGATPKSRAQMGLRGKTEPKKLGTVASILAAKRGA